MAELFGCSSDNISLHLKNVYSDGELDETATAEEISVVQTEGSRQVRRKQKFYNLDNPGDSNPDLIYEMNKYLEVLFEDQKDTGTYISLMSGINAVASDARDLDEDDTNQGRYYMALKDCEYDYLEQLTLYVPKLLRNEDFFSSVFQ